MMDITAMGEVPLKGTVPVKTCIGKNDTEST